MAMHNPPHPGEFITGMIEMKVPAGTFATSLLVTQADGRGAVIALNGVATPRAEPVLQVSDIVLGREGSSVRWNSGSSLISLNPLNAYPKGGAAEVYYQLSGLMVGTPYDTKFELYRAGELDKPAKLRVAFKETPQQSRGEVTRTLGLTNLEPGQYQIRLVISGGGHQASALSWLTIAAH